MAQAAGGKNTLSIRDNRTGKDYEVEIHEGDVIRAMDLRKIKVQEDDFGMMAYDPAFTNTANTRSTITYIDGDKGILRGSTPARPTGRRCARRPGSSRRSCRPR